MPTTSNFGWTTPADTDLVKDGAAAIRTLGNGIDTSFLDLKGGTTGQILSKNSNTDLDFTWIANDQGDITAVTAGTGITGGGTAGAVTITNDMATTITAAGDIVVGTGNATYDNLPIGTTGQVLTADTTVSPYKVKWATAAGGGKLLQLVSAVYSTETTVTSTSYTDTGLSLSITPSAATSKVLVMVSQATYYTRSAVDTGFGLQIVRGATSIFDQANALEYGTAYFELSGNTSAKGFVTTSTLVYLDSPSTTSSTTYKTQGKVVSGTTARFQNGSTKSTITLFEIGA
jgi:hypothetical protein